MSSMQVDTNVSEADVGEVHDGQKATFSVQAFPNRTFEAKVRQVRKGPITVQNVVTYDVVLDVDNRDLVLLPGMTSDTHIITAERKNVLRVPLPATRFVPEGMGRSERGSGGARGGGSAGAPTAGRASTNPAGGKAETGGASVQNGEEQRRHRFNPDVAGGPRPPGAADDGVRGPGGGGAGARRNRGPRGVARIWVLRNEQLVPVTVRTGLDDGTLIEVWSDDLKEGDEVVVNAVRPNAPRPAAGERPAGAGGQGQPNGRAGGNGFRL
jgi:HlyD family secretion protein